MARKGMAGKGKAGFGIAWVICFIALIFLRIGQGMERLGLV